MCSLGVRIRIRIRGRKEGAREQEHLPPTSTEQEWEQEQELSRRRIRKKSGIKMRGKIGRRSRSGSTNLARLPLPRSLPNATNRMRRSRRFLASRPSGSAGRCAGDARELLRAPSRSDTPALPGEIVLLSFPASRILRRAPGSACQGERGRALPAWPRGSLPCGEQHPIPSLLSSSGASPAMRRSRPECRAPTPFAGSNRGGRVIRIPVL